MNAHEQFARTVLAPKATLVQLAWYLERDGATIIRHEADGAQVIRVPLGAGGHVTYRVPAEDVAALNAYRDEVYRTLAAKRREAAAR